MAPPSECELVGTSVPTVQWAIFPSPLSLLLPCSGILTLIEYNVFGRLGVSTPIMTSIRSAVFAGRRRVTDWHTYHATGWLVAIVHILCIRCGLKSTKKARRLNRATDWSDVRQSLMPLVWIIVLIYCRGVWRRCCVLLRPTRLKQNVAVKLNFIVIVGLQMKKRHSNKSTARLLLQLTKSQPTLYSGP